MCRANADDHEFSFWRRWVNLYVPAQAFRPEQFDVNAIDDGEDDRGERMAHAAGHYHLRLPDRRDRFRPASGARPVSHADVVSLQLGPRRVRARACPAGIDLGCGDSLRRCNCRSLRHAARFVSRRGALLLWTRADGAFDHAWHARVFRRRSHRPRHCRHVVHAGVGSVQQINAA